MKQPTHPPHELDTSGVLTPTDYTAAVNLWRSVRNAGGPALTQCLIAPGAPARLPALYFPVMQIVELVSAVGVQSIRARFVVLRDEKKQPHFSVVLFAVGANEVVLSSYYLAQRYWQLQAGSAAPGQPGPLRLSRDAPKHALPKALAEYWAANWADHQRYPTSPALFTSAGQPLDGYNFALSDLMDLLRGLNDFNNQLLLMSFGLHTFLNFNGQADAPVATLGLMLRITNTGAKDDDGDGDDAFDVGIPSPPGP